MFTSFGVLYIPTLRSWPPVVTLASTNDFIWVFSACVLLTYFLLNCYVLWQGVEEVYLFVVSFSHVLQYDQLVLFSNQAALICEKQYWISLSIFNPLFMRLVENFQFSMTYVQNIFCVIVKSTSLSIIRNVIIFRIFV